MSETATSESSTGPIIATAGRYYRNARYIMLALIIGFAVFFAYDGWVRYPKVNDQIREVEKKLDVLKNKTLRSDDEERDLSKLHEEQKDLGSIHSDTDIMFQKVLACVLPVVAIAYGIFFINRSRGEVVLRGDTLSSPGHPEIKISDIKSIDNSKWDKKGIADLKYDTGSASGVLRLDGFIYEQGPIDRIYEIIAKAHGIWKEPVKSEPTETNS